MVKPLENEFRSVCADDRSLRHRVELRQAERGDPVCKKSVNAVANADLILAGAQYADRALYAVNIEP